MIPLDPVAFGVVNVGVGAVAGQPVVIARRVLGFGVFGRVDLGDLVVVERAVVDAGVVELAVEFVVQVAMGRADDQLVAAEHVAGLRVRFAIDFLAVEVELFLLFEALGPHKCPTIIDSLNYSAQLPNLPRRVVKERVASRGAYPSRSPSVYVTK
jgi:hypothetical protein